MECQIGKKSAITKFDLRHHIYHLLEEEPFFASFSTKVKYIPTLECPTACVNFNKKTFEYEMDYNPEFMMELDGGDVTKTMEKSFILKHEFYHIIYGHLQGCKVLNKRERFLLNIAWDLAINDNLFPGSEYEEINVAKHMCVPTKTHFKDYPRGLSSEAYFNLLKKDSRSFEEYQSIEDHFEVSDELSLEISKRILNETLEEAIKEATVRGWGSIPESMQKEIFSFTETKLDWRRIFRYFVLVSQRSEKRSAIHRVNKRNSYVFPGSTVSRQAEIAIAIDQSGSVENTSLVTFFSELKSLSAMASFTVIPFDCKVDEENIFTWKKGESVKTIRTCNGGTDFNAPTEYINKSNKFDALIILTDLEADIPNRCKVKRLWITDTKNELNVKEPILRIE